jgi:hypothetical protein
MHVELVRLKLVIFTELPEIILENADGRMKNVFRGCIFNVNSSIRTMNILIENNLISGLQASKLDLRYKRKHQTPLHNWPGVCLGILPQQHAPGQQSVHKNRGSRGFGVFMPRACRRVLLPRRVDELKALAARHPWTSSRHPEQQAEKKVGLCACVRGKPGAAEAHGAAAVPDAGLELQGWKVGGGMSGKFDTHRERQDCKRSHTLDVTVKHGRQDGPKLWTALEAQKVRVRHAWHLSAVRVLGTPDWVRRTV